MPRRPSHTTALPHRPCIRLDDHGVYHLAGRDPSAVAEAFGHLQATAHPHGLFTAFASARGRLAAVFGPEDPTARGRERDRDARVAWDLDVRRFRFAAHARRLWRELDDTHRPWIEGFAAGVERARRELRAEAPPGLLRRLLAERVTPTTILALDFRIAIHHELGRTDHERRVARASNAIAVGGHRARGGGGWLLVDPHIPLSAMPELRLLAVAIRTRGYAAAGFARLGSPIVFLGFSRHLAWTISTNWPDTLRWYALRRRGDHYVDGVGETCRHYRRIVHDVEIPVHGRAPRRFTLSYAGRLDRPIVRGLPGGRAAAVTCATFTAGALTAQLYRAAIVRTVPAFRRQVLAITGASNTNFIVADRDGRIGCAWHGRVPAAGGGFLDPVRDMPFDDGGDGGLLVQNNAHFDRVRLGPGLRLLDFPARVSDGPSVSSFRQDRSFRLLAPRRSIGRRELEGIVSDVHDQRGRVFVALVAGACTPSALRPLGVGIVRRVRTALREATRWGGSYGIGNRRATLVALWMERAFRRDQALVAAFERPQFVPSRLRIAAVRRAALALVAAHDDWRGAGRPRWGDVHRYRIAGRSFPVAGASHTNRNAGWASAPDLDAGTIDFPVETGSAAALVVHLTARSATARLIRTLGPFEDPSRLETLAAIRAWTTGTFVPLRLD